MTRHCAVMKCSRCHRKIERAASHSEFDGLNQRKQHFSLDRKDKPMNFLDGALFPETCIIAAASFVVAQNGYQADEQRIDEPKAIHTSQGVFA